jgi:hypothetical protein
MYCSGKENDGVIAKKIEQAMDLVKSHLVVAVQEELEVVKVELDELRERNQFLEAENTFLRQKRANEHSKRDVSVQASAAPLLAPPSVLRSNSEMSVDTSYSASSSDSAISMGTGSEARTTSPPNGPPTDQNKSGSYPYILVPMRSSMAGQNADASGSSMYQGISYIPMPIMSGSGGSNPQLPHGMPVMDFSFFQQTASMMQSMGSGMQHTIPLTLSPEPGGHRMSDSNTSEGHARKSSDSQPAAHSASADKPLLNGGAVHNWQHNSVTNNFGGSAGQYCGTPQPFLAMQQHIVSGYHGMGGGALSGSSLPGPGGGGTQVVDGSVGYTKSGTQTQQQQPTGNHAGQPQSGGGGANATVQTGTNSTAAGTNA